MGAFEEMGYDTHKIDAFVLETIITLEDLFRSKILEQVLSNGKYQIFL
jgi:hypothetical protein